MDTSRHFFGKLRSLAVLLETETANLQQEYMDTDNDNTEEAERILHELHTEVRDLQGQVQGQLACCEAEGKEMRKFMQNCLVLKQRTTEDIHRLKKHFEKYGYRPPTSTQMQLEVQDQEGEGVATGTQEQEKKEDQEHLPSMTPVKIPPPASTDPMRTPRLSDFGLSEANFREWSNLGKSLGEVPQAPCMTAPTLAATSQPVLPKTPKCALRMDEEALTPRLEDFGITEHTMCLNNDFTMDLLRKKDSKPCRSVAGCGNPEAAQRPEQHTPAPASSTHSSETSETMDSPEPPSLMTPGFKLKKTQACLSTPPNEDADPQHPVRPGHGRSTPEVPVFETPYVVKFLNVVKSRERDHCTDADQEEKPRPNEHPSSSRAPDASGVWTRDVPDLPLRLSQTDEPTPEMPTLEMFLGNSFPHRTRADGKLLPEEKGAGEQLGLNGETPPSLECHEIYTQEWRLATPPGRADCTMDPRTPEMPDVSSVTQDIFKLVSQCNTKASAPVDSNLKPGAKPNPKAAALTAATAGKENWSQGLAPVSEKEFMSLPGYLRQMQLSSLNQAIQKISDALEDGHSGGDADSSVFPIEDLRRITGVGLKAPIYFLCLTELKRLAYVQGEGASAVYRVLTSS
ncbi:spindle and kinetochore-associated protein 3 [Megalops cyprinoides]|uniref:spindle and kinetochore-associated protein 3 n=1 Tax=Megalops cyprinoides TaxID=118141 RepID=UPI001864DE07|nr:spindle and kinetochore-associated protein 3 [Megalops cyprinoides]